MFAFSHYAAEDTLEKKMEHKSFKALIQAPSFSLSLSLSLRRTSALVRIGASN
jgi:hypothetical protein